MSYSSKTRAPGRPGARGRGRASGAAFTTPRSTTPSFTSASHPSYRPSDVSAASVGVERMSEEGAQFFRDLVPGARGAKNTRGALGMPNHDSHTPIRDEAATGDAATHALSQRKHNNNNTRAPAGNVLPGESLGVHTREPGSRQTQDHISWVQLGLCKALVRAVTHMNFITPTPVQAAAIPYALEGRDVCARAVTGSGKTAAFLLPLLNHLLTHPPMYASMGPCGKGTQRHAPNGHYHVGHRNSSSSSHYGTDNQTIHAEGAEGDYDAGDKASRGGAAGRAFLSNRRRIRSLILVPTRELGAQCESMLRPLLRFAKTPPQVALAIGGVAPQAQEAALSAAPDIVLATPGRLVDLLYNLHTNKYTSAATGRGSLPSSSSSSSSSPRRIDLTGVEVVVLDECDKMLSATLRDQVCDIVQRIPVETRQMLLFSATMTEEVDRFAQEHLYKPRNVDVGHVALQARLRQQFVRIASTTGLRASPSSFAAPLRTADTNTHTHVNDYERLADVPKEEHISITKTRYLVALCMNYITSGRSIIFCHYRTTVHRLALLMNALKLPTCEVQGGQTQEERFAALQDFTSGRVRYLVTTDVAARGWDVPDVTTVINYDLPPTLTAYIHRVGRTARIGADGTAVSLVEDERDGAVMRKILALSGGGTSGGGKRDRRGNKSTSKDDNDDDATANNNNSNSDNTDQTDEGVSVSQDTNDEEAERDAAVNAMMQHTVASVRRRDIPAAVLQCAAAAIDAVFDHVRTQLAAEQLVAQVTQAERRLSATTSTSTASTNEGRRDAAQLPQALQQRITAAPERRWCLSRQEQQRRHEESRLAYEKEVEQTRNHFQNELATLQQEESRLGQQQRQSRRAGRERAAQAQEKVRAQRRAERAKEQSRLQAGVVKKLKQRKIREAAREKREEARLAKRGGANERRRYNERGKRTSAKKSRHRGKVKKH